MFRKILVAIDGSRHAIEALDKAIELQKLTGAELYLLCVYKHHSLFEASLSIGRPSDVQIPDSALESFAKEVVEDAKNHAKEQGSAEVRGFVKSGKPSKTIVEFAADKSIDLIILGSKGTHGDKDGLFLGSVAQRVAGSAKCATMVV
ncbi:universal stress protein [Marinobacter sp.]|uniref:universal stress protein n=1 Tax=Marinobacter sp. TaxID=50741 RepID=UPI0038513E78